MPALIYCFGGLLCVQKGLFTLVGAPQAKIDLVFKGKGDQALKTVIVRTKGEDPHATEELPLYTSGGSVYGDVRAKDQLQALTEISQLVGLVSTLACIR